MRAVAEPAMSRYRSVLNVVYLAGDTCFREGCHSEMHCEGRSDNRQRDGGARRLTQSHLEIEDRFLAELRQQAVMSRLGRKVRNKAVVECALVVSK